MDNHILTISRKHKNTLISLGIITLLILFVLWLSNSITDTDFGGVGYIFVIVYGGIMLGLVLVIFRLLQFNIDKEKLFYNLIGTLNLTFGILLTMYDIYIRLAENSNNKLNFFEYTIFGEIIIGLFIIIDIYKRTKQQFQT